MFYCETCRKAEGWPETSGVSKGVCEICGSLGMCWDLPASMPPPKRQKQAAPAAHRDGGGPAFPCVRNGIDIFGRTHPIQEAGMALRDWLAGKALIGELSSQDEASGQWTDLSDLARRCYAAADALLAERERTEPQ